MPKRSDQTFRLLSALLAREPIKGLADQIWKLPERRVSEDGYLDYKRGSFLRKARTERARELRRMVSGFANAEGGVVLIGVAGDEETSQNRTHVAGISANGVVRYASYCRESDGCTYRIGEWTQTVEYDQSASVAATLHHDDGLVASGYGPYLYLVWTTSTFGGQPLQDPMLVWQYKRSE